MGGGVWNWVRDLTVEGRDTEASAARIGPRKLGNSSVNRGRGTHLEQEVLKKKIGWKLILEKSRVGERMERLIIFKLLATSRSSSKDM